MYGNGAEVIIPDNQLKYKQTTGYKKIIEINYANSLNRQVPKLLKDNKGNNRALIDLKAFFWCGERRHKVIVTRISRVIKGYSQSNAFYNNWCKIGLCVENKKNVRLKLREKHIID
ncbi:hypothetical protein IB642_07515 [Allofrancisella guangzhouensis]|uniref:Uncharacterized protein n=1 Tax=Allofrancisella guangzhouensis TaxID=594679 RepID=A0A0A8EA43_9GAMM|nr:hypothetical protein [Allofrancisella guangzhouensis]AJC49031.1 hypothetical protein SD28_04975 [Allofrancisella guangzhouensis]MBK2044861.1 hypothetical protein [Allofrancisella guangzhouensis]MBK2046074.1 hypothetical protein [Allofrancisella guangzhouensis]